MKKNVNKKIQKKVFNFENFAFFLNVRVFWNFLFKFFKFSLLYKDLKKIIKN
jgi:hypothetical protein